MRFHNHRPPITTETNSVNNTPKQTVSGHQLSAAARFKQGKNKRGASASASRLATARIPAPVRAVMAWWRKKVVFPARRVLAAVSTRVSARKAGSGGSILKLHEDVQTCGYKDVQVMFEILTSELEGSHATKAGPKQPPHLRRRPPSAWSSRSSSIAAAQ